MVDVVSQIDDAMTSRKLVVFSINDVGQVPNNYPKKKYKCNANS